MIYGKATKGAASGTLHLLDQGGQSNLSPVSVAPLFQ